LRRKFGAALCVREVAGVLNRSMIGKPKIMIIFMLEYLLDTHVGGVVRLPMSWIVQKFRVEVFRTMCVRSWHFCLTLKIMPRRLGAFSIAGGAEPLLLHVTTKSTTCDIVDDGKNEGEYPALE
jgi:hypothetical protein